MAGELDQSFYMDEQLGLDLQQPLGLVEEVGLDLNLLSMKEARVETVDESATAEDLFSEIFSHLTKCRTCKGMFTFGDLEKHAQACLNSVHATSKCSQCRKKFSGLNKLAKHKKKTHNMDRVSKEGYVDKNTKRICINHSIFSSTS